MYRYDSDANVSDASGTEEQEPRKRKPPSKIAMPAAKKRKTEVSSVCI